MLGQDFPAAGACWIDRLIEKHIPDLGHAYKYNTTTTQDS